MIQYNSGSVNRNCAAQLEIHGNDINCKMYILGIKLVKRKHHVHTDEGQQQQTLKNYTSNKFEKLMNVQMKY